MVSGLVDQFGRPVAAGALGSRVVETLLAQAGGARLFGGADVSSNMSPQRLGRLLREAEDGDPEAYFGLAERMEEKDLHYLSVLGTRKRQVAQLELSVKPASDADEDRQAAALVEEAIEDAGLDAQLFDMLDAVGKGLSLTEIVWETGSRRWMPAGFVHVDPQLITFDRETRSRPLLRGLGGDEELAPFKFVRVEIRAKSGLPVRAGLARPVAWAWLFKNFGLKDWARFAEAYGQPLRLGKFGAGATEAEKRALLSSLVRLGSDAAAVVPQSMAVEFVKDASVGASADLFERWAVYLDQQISKAVLGQVATTDAIAGGHAVSKEHNEVRGDIERADAAALARALTRDFAQPVVDLNLGPRRRYPKIVIGRPSESDAALMIQAAKDLVPLGLRVGQGQIRAAVGLSDPEDEDELLGQPQNPPEGVSGGLALEGGQDARNVPGGIGEPRNANPRPLGPLLALKPAARAAASAAGRPAPPKPARPAVSDLIAQLAEDAGQATIDEVLEALRRAAQEAESLADLRDSLTDLYPRIKTDALGRIMAEAMTLARLAGEEGEDRGPEDGPDGSA